jgi:hypothetical protein
MATTLLEPELEPHYNAWKADKTPEANATILKQLQPDLDKIVKVHVGQNNPILNSQARRLTIDALQSYDPSRSRLRTHLFNQLQSLKRISRQQRSILHIPERVVLDKYHLDRHTQELIDTVGRDPSDEELADHTGFSLKRIQHVRSFRPAVAEGTLEAAGPEGQQEIFGPISSANRQLSAWHDLVYGELSPMDKVIFEHSLGYNGKRVLSNNDIAGKIKRTPGFVSQRKKIMQDTLDRQELNPF